MRTLAGMVVMGVALALAGAQSVAGGHVAHVTPGTEAPNEARALSRAFAGVARAIGPSVVRIEVQTARERGTASGIVIDTRGYVVTSNHVLEGAPSIERRASSFPTAAGWRPSVVGRDAPSDVAVVRLRVPPHDLSAARFGDSDAAEMGEWVLAVGSPLGLEQTITAGIISGRAHRWRPATGSLAQVYLQTDAKVNPGNSGGPIVNLDGEVVGLSALISAGPGGSYGYAVPINLVRRTAAALIEGGHMPHPYIGVALRDVRGSRSAEITDWSFGSRPLPPRGSLVSASCRTRRRPAPACARATSITSINNRDIPALGGTGGDRLRATMSGRESCRRGAGGRRAMSADVGGRPARDDEIARIRPGAARRAPRAPGVRDVSRCPRPGRFEGHCVISAGAGRGASAGPSNRSRGSRRSGRRRGGGVRRERLLQPNEEAERPDLSAVGVAGQLQSDAERRGIHQRRAAGGRAGRALASGRDRRARGRGRPPARGRRSGRPSGLRCRPRSNPLSPSPIATCSF